MKRHVFISHSSNDADNDTARIRDAVRERLEHKGYVVFVDTASERHGERWRKTLAGWMNDCDYALVLIDDEALKPDKYIVKEANYLYLRWVMKEEPQIYPMLLGVTHDQLDGRGLDELQELHFVRIEGWGEPDAVDQITQQISKLFPPVGRPGARTPLQLWVRQVSDMLVKVRPDRRREAASLLKLDSENVRDAGRDDGHVFLASQFIMAGLSWDLVDAVYAVVRQVDNASLLAKLLAPTWVDHDAAQELSRQLPGRHKPVAVLNASVPRTGLHYVDRAHCCYHIQYRARELGELPVGEESDGHKVNIESALRDVTGLRSISLSGQKQLQERRYYMVVDVSKKTSEKFRKALTEVHGAFADVVLLLLTGNPPISDEELAGLGGGDVLRLEPLKPRAEHIGQQLVDVLLDMCGS